MLFNTEDFMSRSIIFTREKDYLYRVRGMILENSYSYIPIQIDKDYYFVSDFEVSKVWMKLSKADKYSKKLGGIIKSGHLKLIPAKFVNTNDDLEEIVRKMESSQLTPILVKDEDGDLMA
ncbi:hypothetical protein DEFR109230_19805 [Deinococcus frigens]